MSTCKDCISYDRCQKNYLMQVADLLNIDIDTLDKGRNKGKFNIDDDTVCEFFKDKSKIVELPCKVGDKVFVVRSATSNGDNLYILEDVVKRIITEKATDINAIWTRVEFKNITSSFEWEFSNIFLTKEAAEKALENIKNKGEKLCQ